MVCASNCLNAIPLAEHGINLSEGEFQDALAFHFNHGIKGLLNVLLVKDLILHICNELGKRGGFVIMRYKDIRDFEENLLKKSLKRCWNRTTSLNPDKWTSGKRAINTDLARLEQEASGEGVKMHSLMQEWQIQVLQHKPKHNWKFPGKAWKGKKRAYKEWIMNVGQGTFIPLVFTVLRGCARKMASIINI